MRQEKFFRFITGVAFIVFMGAIFTSYYSGKKETPEDSIVPVVSADKSPIKVKPENEGGMEIPFRETEIYASVDSSNYAKEDVIEPIVEEKKVEPAKEASSVVTSQNDMADLIGSLTERNQKSVKVSARKSKSIEATPFKTHRVQLGSFKTKSDAEKAWDELKVTYPKTLQDIDLYIEDANTPSGVYYRVQSSLIPKSYGENICRNISNCLVIKAK